MSSNFVQSAFLRSTALGACRLYARSQVWRRGPRVFVNSVPKAGTHLLTAELARFGALQNSWLHVQIPQVARVLGLEAGGAPEYDIDRFARYVATVRSGQFFSAHMPWSVELETFLARSDVRSVFMTRDPRAILVSRMHYIRGLRRHRLHEFLNREFATDTERYHVLIDGHTGEPPIVALSGTMGGFVPWAKVPGVLMVRFEDLVGERGGGSAEVKRETLARIARHCGLPIDQLDTIAATGTGATPTLRKGQANAWRDELPAEIAQRFTREFAPVLEAFGYPVD